MIPKAPERLETPRLLLRRPVAADAEPIFRAYASDPSVTLYVGFPRHHRVADTEKFIAWSDAQWATHPGGPYLILLRAGGVLVGGTGLTYDAPFRAATGYVLATSAWGHGYATEALGAMVDVAAAVGLQRLAAVCHHEHRASARVLEKGGFSFEGTLRRFAEFPNLEPGRLCDVRSYSRIFDISTGTEGKMRS